MTIRDLVDLAIDDDLRAPLLWIPSEHWLSFCAAIGQQPNLIGAVIYRGKTIRDGGPRTEIMARH